MGTHPIFESDFDCLTDIKGDQNVRDSFEKLENCIKDNRSLVKL